jgi:hypothetical protein
MELANWFVFNPIDKNSGNGSQEPQALFNLRTESKSLETMNNL